MWADEGEENSMLVDDGISDVTVALLVDAEWSVAIDAVVDSWIFVAVVVISDATPGVMVAVTAGADVTVDSIFSEAVCAIVDVMAGVTVCSVVDVCVVILADVTTGVTFEVVTTLVDVLAGVIVFTPGDVTAPVSFLTADVVTAIISAEVVIADVVVSDLGDSMTLVVDETWGDVRTDVTADVVLLLVGRRDESVELVVVPVDGEAVVWLATLGVAADTAEDVTSVLTAGSELWLVALDT